MLYSLVIKGSLVSIFHIVRFRPEPPILQTTFQVFQSVSRRGCVRPGKDFAHFVLRRLDLRGLFVSGLIVGEPLHHLEQRIHDICHVTR